MDVKATDWAFQALQSLVERYGCIAGYPTNPPTYQGQKILSRYEFAAGLNACLDRINELIGSATEPLITQDDLLVLRKLQDEFSNELGILRGRVDVLEARTSTLEQQQFSTTTKLRGEIIFAPYGVSDGDAAYNRVELAQLNRNFTGAGNVPGVVTPVLPGSPVRGVKQNRQSALALGYRVRLNFLGSFSGQDLLQVRLEAADIANLATATGSFASRLGYETTTGGNVVIDDLWYRFPFAQGRGEIQIAGASNEFVDFFDTYSIFAPSVTGSISRFGHSNALFYRSGGHNGTGAFIRYRFAPQFVVSGGYIATNPSGGVLGSANGAANPDLGLFGSNYTGAIILGFEPLTNFRFGLAYTHAYNENVTTSTGGTTAQGINLFGGVGTSFANAPFGSGAGTRLAVNLDTINVNFQWRSSPRFILSGWFGYGIARGETDAAHKKPHQLSGGMKQRVSIARALAMRPQVLLLDEPFGALDPITREELQDQLLDIWQNSKVTVVMITHDIDEAVYLSDRIVMMTNGPAATIGEVLSIPFPRPRRREMLMEDPRFFTLRNECLSFLYDRFALDINHD